MKRLEWHAFRWRGRSWLETVLHDEFDRDWEFVTTINLHPRPDTGAINHSPVAAMITMFRAQETCQQTLTVPGEYCMHFFRIIHVTTCDYDDLLFGGCLIRTLIA